MHTSTKEMILQGFFFFKLFFFQKIAYLTKILFSLNVFILLHGFLISIFLNGSIIFYDIKMQVISKYHLKSEYKWTQCFLEMSLIKLLSEWTNQPMLHWLNRPCWHPNPHPFTVCTSPLRLCCIFLSVFFHLADSI